MSRKRMTKIYIFFLMWWKYGNKCWKLCIFSKPTQL
ncbi:hypothetical protein BACOVA_03376 [Bacteroides ovatus ATCC 8483]|uniref:Uncharacterized protein n=1 Tax=Bacteroides ovatus (strain ATCC 8483 / DSM 1896 / JCM 5824 / BCRC 10623 / CCUG 4943 / NCTC 11153) TaxID=411476 RepID=A0AAN3D6K6_BACO1|nr:hypothetical protein BACOVA_03376 [Bacteroides ovatus ATCC 8483]